MNFAAHDHFKRFFQRQAAKPEELVFIRMRFALRKPLRQIDGDFFRAKARCGQNRGQVGHMLGGKSSFLLQLANGAVKRVFLCAVELARGDFQRYAVGGNAILANQQRISVGIDGNDRRRALMQNKLARRLPPVGAGDRPFFDVQNVSLIDAFFFYGNLAQCAVVHRFHIQEKNSFHGCG